MAILLDVLLLTIGLLLGSFLGVLADRLPRGENPLIGRSHCDFCKHTLSGLDLVPLLSFVYLRARCRYCRHRLSWQYPLIELASAAMFVTLAWFVTYQFGTLFMLHNVLIYTSLAIVFASFFVIVIADFNFQIIPDELIITGIIGAAFYLLLQYGVNFETLGNHLLAAVCTSAFFLLIYIITKRKGIGFGDVKLALVLGLLLGFPMIIIGLYVAFLTGAIVSSILILSKQKKWGQRIAFGPFLILGTITSFVAGIHILNWYLALIGF
jgi:leader peptidase (prepilin peptidase)/N-methyltransferase